MDGNKCNSGFKAKILDDFKNGILQKDLFKTPLNDSTRRSKY